MTNPISQSPSWLRLEELARAQAAMHLRERFAIDPDRFNTFSLRAEGMLLDYSKQRIDTQILATLRALFHAADVPAWTERMRSGEAINTSENRAVLHIALRHQGSVPVTIDGQDVMPEVRKVLAQMKQFCADVHSGKWVGGTGERLSLIHI